MQRDSLVGAVHKIKFGCVKHRRGDNLIGLNSLGDVGAEEEIGVVGGKLICQDTSAICLKVMDKTKMTRMREKGGGSVLCWWQRSARE